MVPVPLLILLVAGPGLAESPWGPAPAPIGWSASDAVWRLHIRDGEAVRVEATYTLRSPDARGEVLRLVGPELLITSVSGPVLATPEGLELALRPETRTVKQSFEGLYAGDDGALELGILPATRTRVEIDAPGLDVTVNGAVDGWLTPTEHLSVSWRPQVDGEVIQQGLLAQGEAATVFRDDGGGLLVEGVLRWRVLRGEAKRLTVDVAGLDELEIAGPGVAKWRKEGAQVVIEPKAPVTGLFAVTIKGRVRLGKGESTVPSPAPAGVQRVDRYVTMARSDEGELIPIAMPSSVPMVELPAWAKNLGDGVPLAAWHGPQPVRVLVAGGDNLQGPDTVVTQARYTLAAAQEGRLALRMNLRVRNERRQYLHVKPATGWRPIVVRVGNQPVSGLADGAGGLYIPLEKSIETVKGLLSFPVDVEWIGVDQLPWQRRGEMELTLPSVDAPVQAARWEVHLPRGFRALRTPTRGSGTMLVGDLRQRETVADQSVEAEADRRKQEVVSSALQNAVSAYKENDWSTAQGWLDEAKNVDAANEDAALLQDNLDVLEGRNTKNDMGSRRVKDMARAKASGLEEQQKEVARSADYLYRSGDLDAAERAYEQSIVVANELKKIEQFENAEQTSNISVATRKLAEVRSEKMKRHEADKPSSYASSSFSFGGDAIEGGLVGDELGVSLGGVSGGSSGESVGYGELATIAVGDRHAGVADDGNVGLGVNGEGRGGQGFGYGSGSGSVVDTPDAGIAFEAAPEEATAAGEPMPEAATTPRTKATKGFGLKKKKVEEEERVEGPSRESSGADNDDEQMVFEKKPAQKPPPGRPPVTAATPRPAPAMAPAMASPPPPSPPSARMPSKAGRATAESLVVAADDQQVYPDANGDESGRDRNRWSGDAEPADVTGAEDGKLRPRPDRPRPLPERRAALVASASPMALAMPLDGPTLTTDQALLPAGQFPTFQFHYRQTSPEKP
ncbi:MAG: hypothetical protein EXR71_21160 [Myxococcales bacterium]|nr:hypothetical protein [Myxococcales bacterium]